MNLDYEKLEIIGTKIIENEKFHELLLTFTNKGLLDYALPLASITLAAITIILSYKSFNTRIKEIKNEQIILKDIDKLYESSSSFFTYIDAAGLFLSLAHKRAIRTIDGTEHEGEFKEHYDFADKDFFPKISKIKEAAFILKTLESNELALKLESLNDFIIEERRKQLLIFKNNNQNDLMSIKNNYENFRAEMKVKVENCINDLVKVKKKLSKKN